MNVSNASQSVSGIALSISALPPNQYCAQIYTPLAIPTSVLTRRYLRVTVSTNRHLPLEQASKKCFELGHWQSVARRQWTYWDLSRPVVQRIVLIPGRMNGTSLDSSFIPNLHITLLRSMTNFIARPIDGWSTALQTRTLPQTPSVCHQFCCLCQQQGTERSSNQRHITDHGIRGT